MYKTVAKRPDWLSKPSIQSIFSVSPCISSDFTEWINFWKHNGFWFFDSPAVIFDLAQAHGIPIDDMTLFFYQIYEKQWNCETESWQEVVFEGTFETNVVIPDQKIVRGYDVVTYSTGNNAECSPLSCNSLATEIPTNEHCLLPDFDSAMELVESGAFRLGEPGPLRLIEVSTLDDA
jgi:hypothetical protein